MFSRFRSFLPLCYCIFFFTFTAFGANAQDAAKPQSRWALEFGPDIDIYFLQAALRASPRDELVLGAIYMNTAIAGLIPYPGEEQIYAFELGWRHFFWKGLHAEILLLPEWVVSREIGAGSPSAGFDLVPELRAGWQFNFKSWGVQWYLTLQWFAGYRLLNPKPASFKAVDGGSFYTSPIPMFLFGLRL